MAEWKSISLTKFKKERGWLWTYVRVFLQGVPLFQLSTLQTSILSSSIFKSKPTKCLRCQATLIPLCLCRFLQPNIKFLKVWEEILCTIWLVSITLQVISGKPNFFHFENKCNFQAISNLLFISIWIKREHFGLPWWCSGWESACQCRGHGFEPCWEDPTCRGAAGPVSHNYWACTSGTCAPQQERPR